MPPVAANLAVTPHGRESFSDDALVEAFHRGDAQEAGPKIFCIGMQRSGTTSTGDFCENQLGMVRRSNRVSRRRGWSRLWLTGEMETVFDDPVFRTGQMFDDGPWWFPGVYRLLHERFPDARFVMFVRDPESWFNSLSAHSRGRSPGNTAVHAKIYGRKEEYEELQRAHGGSLAADHRNGFSLEGQAGRYMRVYEEHVRSVATYFRDNAPDRFFSAPLDDPEKFRKLAVFLGFRDREYEDVRSSVIVGRRPKRADN